MLALHLTVGAAESPIPPSRLPTYLELEDSLAPSRVKGFRNSAASRVPAPAGLLFFTYTVQFLPT